MVMAMDGIGFGIGDGDFTGVAMKMCKNIPQLFAAVVVR